MEGLGFRVLEAGLTFQGSGPQEGWAGWSGLFGDFAPTSQSAEKTAFLQSKESSPYSLQVILKTCMTLRNLYNLKIIVFQHEGPAELNYVSQQSLVRGSFPK